MSPYIYLFLLCAVLKLATVRSVVHNYTCSNEKWCKTAVLMRGCIVPVFPTYDSDESFDINVVESYAKYLVSKGIKTIIVNAAITGSLALSQRQRRANAKEWMRVSKLHGLNVIIQIGGVALPDIIEEGLYAKQLNATAVMMMPSIYYVANTTQQTIDLVTPVAAAVYPLTILLYVPAYALGYTLNVPRLFRGLSSAIPNFGGVKCSFESGVEIFSSTTLKPYQVVIEFGSYSHAAAFSVGFNATSNLVGNLYPRRIVNIYKAVASDSYNVAHKLQHELNKNISAFFILLRSEDGELSRSLYTYRAPIAREAFKYISSIDVGSDPVPLAQLSPRLKQAIRHEAQNQGYQG